MPTQPLAFATEADALTFDFTLPASTLTEAACHTVGQAFADELDAFEKDERDSPRARVLLSLASALQMHARLELPRAPYGPMMEWHGKRTPIPTDWEGDAVAGLVTLGTRATNPAIKARLFDVAWFVERRRVQTGHDAVAAYIAVARGLRGGTLVDAADAELPGVAINTLQEALRRALQITRQLCPPEPEGPELIALVLDLANDFEVAGQRSALMAMLRLIHEFDLNAPRLRAERLERLVNGADPDDEAHGTVETLTLAAAAWREAGDVEGHERCLMAASAVFSRQAETIEGDFAASHWVQQALDLLRGLRSPAAKAAKQALRARLVQLQSTVNEELGTFEHAIDLTDIIEATTAHLEGVTLFDGLFVLADVARSRDPEALAAEARESIARYPLSAMFAIQQHDAHGYVRFRAPGAMPGHSTPEVLEHQVARSEALTRELIVKGQIDVVIRKLAQRFPIGERDLFTLLRQSAFVPPDLVRSYARGLASFLHNDMISALAILAPMLEASVLHVLKSAGVDVVFHNENDKTQEDVSIQRVFDRLRSELDGIFGEDVTGDIERVFLARSGPALRHAIAHGDFHDRTAYTADARYGCWLLFRLCLLPLFENYEARRQQSTGGLTRNGLPG